MENIIDSESPLAAYLEGRFFLHDSPLSAMLLLHIRAVVLLSELLTTRIGEGKGEDARTSSRPASPVQKQSFAPKGPPAFSRIKRNLPQPLRLHIPHDGPLARIYKACSVRDVLKGLVRIRKKLIWHRAQYIRISGEQKTPSSSSIFVTYSWHRNY